MTSTTTNSKDNLNNAPYAIVESSGQQFWLQANRYYDIDRLQAKENETVTIEKVLFYNDGKKASLGKPYVKNAKVELEVLEHRRGTKIIVYKMRPKKKTRRKNGHRQELTRVMVKTISIGGQATKTEKDSKASSTKKTSKSVKALKASTTNKAPSRKEEENAQIETSSNTAKPSSKPVKAPKATKAAKTVTKTDSTKKAKSD